jgi:pimeloyl-ACP methyl ester carboxylesterase
MTDRLSTVRSADGTTIAYEEFGSGPPLVLVHGGVSDRTYWAPVLPALTERFTVVCLDRRGRAASGDAPTYSIDREFDDVAAVVDALDEPVHLVGHSYAGICALEAALRTHNLRTLTLYEPALGFDGPDGIPAEFIDQLEALVAAGEREAAVELMMGELVGLSGEMLAELRTDPVAWRSMVDSVHTLPRELRSVVTFAFDPERYRSIALPTLLLRGAESSPEMHVGVDLVHHAIPGSRVITMPGVDHEAVTTGPDVLSTTLTTELSTKQPTST